MGAFGYTTYLSIYTTYRTRAYIHTHIYKLFVKAGNSLCNILSGRAYENNAAW